MLKDMKVTVDALRVSYFRSDYCNSRFIMHLRSFAFIKSMVFFSFKLSIVLK